MPPSCASSPPRGTGRIAMDDVKMREEIIFANRLVLGQVQSNLFSPDFPFLIEINYQHNCYNNNESGDTQEEYWQKRARAQIAVRDVVVSFFPGNHRFTVCFIRF